MSSPEHRQRILLICPRLFSYQDSIKAALEALGFDVTWWDDRGTDSVICKIGLRLLPEPFANRLTGHFERMLGALLEAEASSIRHVLVVKGEGLSVEFIRTLRRRLPGVPASLYLWDSTENAPRARTIAPLFDHVATFDPVDSEALGWALRPLFARNASKPDAARNAAAYDWCFIGTLHSDRYRVLDRLKRSEPTLRSYFFGYAPNRLLLAVRFLTDWRLWRAPRGSVSTRPMATADVEAIVRDSRAIIDIEHPRQRGLTMRTIETLLAGRKLVTTNRHIERCDLFHPSRVHVIDRNEPSIPNAFLAAAFEPIAEAVRSRYQIGQWAQDLLQALPASDIRRDVKPGAL